MCRLHRPRIRTVGCGLAITVYRPPARDVHFLTPWRWKQHFGAAPLRSDLNRLAG